MQTSILHIYLLAYQRWYALNARLRPSANEAPALLRLCWLVSNFLVTYLHPNRLSKGQFMQVYEFNSRQLQTRCMHPVSACSTTYTPSPDISCGFGVAQGDRSCVNYQRYPDI
jgi:hypothetical protein